MNWEKCKEKEIAGHTPTEEDIPLSLLKGIPFAIVGSVKNGIAMQKSDIDLIILEANVQLLRDRIDRLTIDIVEGTYHKGFKILLDGIVINFVPLQAIDFVSWSFASNIMPIIPRYTDSNKNENNAFHSVIVNLIKNRIARMDINNDNYISFCAKDTVRNN